MKACQLNTDGFEFVQQLRNKVLKYFDDREIELRNADTDLNGKNINERIENLHAWRCVREILFSEMEVKQ